MRAMAYKPNYTPILIFDGELLKFTEVMTILSGCSPIMLIVLTALCGHIFLHFPKQVPELPHFIKFEKLLL